MIIPVLEISQPQCKVYVSGINTPACIEAGVVISGLHKPVLQTSADANTLTEYSKLVVMAFSVGRKSWLSRCACRWN